MVIISKFAAYITILVLLKALRDKYTFDWVYEGKNKDLWHLTGFLMLFVSVFFPLWIIVPISLVLLIILFFIGVVIWISFDILLNLIRGLNIFHIGDSYIERLLGKKIYAVKAILLIISVLLILLI